MSLEPEQEALLADLVESARKVSRHEQQWHLGGEYLGENVMAGPWGERQVLVSDVRALADLGLLEVVSLNYVSGNDYVITPKGREYYAAMKQREAEAVERQEGELRRFLGSEGFRAAFPAAYAKWAEAEALLWKANSERELSTIGHKIREATQAFAAALVEEHQPPSVNPSPAAVTARVRAVIDLYRPKLGTRRSAMLDALVDYWSATVDVIQRQEHGEQKGNEPLTWLDGRRVVFHTASLMIEIAATLEEACEPPPVAHLEGG